MTTNTPSVLIGPVACEIRQPAHNWTSDPASSGQRKCSLSGIMRWPQAQYFSEYVANPHLIQTIGNASGVLDRVEMGSEGPYLTFVSGWYLLETFDIKVDAQWGGHGLDYFVGFSLGCSYLGANREAVVISSSHQIANDFGIIGVGFTVDPFPNENADGSAAWLVSDTAGSTITREYDPTSPMTSMGTNSEPLAGLASPTDVAGLACWFKADALALADTNPVASWTDSSVNARPAVQASSTLQPLYRTGIINAKPVVRFDGTNDRLQTATFTLAQPCTMLCVGAFATTAARDMFDGYTINTAVLQATAAPLFVAYSGTFLNGPTADTAFHVFAVQFNGTSSKLWVDGGVATTGNAGAGTPAGVTLGGAGGAGGGYLNGDIAEHITYSVAGGLPISDINRIGSYLATKYNLTWASAS